MTSSLAIGSRPAADAWDLFCRLAQSHAERLRNAFGIFRVRFGEMAELALDDLSRHTLHRPGNVVHQPLLRLLADQTEQVPRLPIVVIALAMVVARSIPGESERRLDKAGILDPTIERVRLVEGVRIASRRLEEAHQPVLVIIMNRAARAIDRECLVMRAEPI